MSRRAATATTCIWRSPSAPVPLETTRWSSTAWSSGIGIWSCAWKRTAVSSSSSSSISGSRRVRTTTRWFATPRRTALPSLLRENRPRQRAGERLGVLHLALADHARGRAARSPCAPTRRAVPRTSVAAMLPVSMSRPTIEVGFLVAVIGTFVESCLTSPSAIGATSPYPGLMIVLPARSAAEGRGRRSSLPDERVQIPVDHLICRRAARRRRRGPGRARRDRALARARPRGGASRRRRRRRREDADQDRRDRRRCPRYRPITAGELHVAHPHPAADRRARTASRKPPAADRGDRPLAEAGGSVAATIATPIDGADRAGSRWGSRRARGRSA